MSRPLRLVVAAVSAAGLGLLASGAAMAGSGAHAPHVLKNLLTHTKASIGPGAAGPLLYNGGAVETAPSVYIVYWGAEWGTGFTTGGYTSSAAQNYVQSFFSNVGGSSWDGVNSQYCQGAAANSINCSGSVQYIANPSGQLKGVWTDTSATPVTPVDSDIAAEAVKAAAHFGYNANANYMVFTPTGHGEAGFKTTWCAWHNITASSSGPLAFSYMPYQPDAGTSCGVNFVNKANDSFGHGYFDGFSIVGGHEYAETLTDPGAGTGWVDASGQETGDKCAWDTASTNVTLGSNYFAVQPLWSNKLMFGLGGCAISG